MLFLHCSLHGSGFQRLVFPSLLVCPVNPVLASWWLTANQRQWSFQISGELLLDLTSTIILCSRHHGIHDYIFLSLTASWDWHRACPSGLLYITSGCTTKKTPPPTVPCCMHIHCYGNILTKPLSNYGHLHGSDWSIPASGIMSQYCLFHWLKCLMYFNIVCNQNRIINWGTVWNLA
jgi:hypothetical protein